MFSFITPKIAGILLVIVVILADIGFAAWQHHRIHILTEELDVANEQLKLAKAEITKATNINKENQDLIESLQTYVKGRDTAVADLQTKVKKVTLSYEELKKKNAAANPDRPICPGVAQAIKDIQERQ